MLMVDRPYVTPSLIANQLASIIIPVGPYHQGFTGAIDSAHRQSIPSEIIIIEDSQGRGPGWARNQGAKEAGGLFLVFLDADDIIAPDFIESCVRAYQMLHYVYTDFSIGQKHIETHPQATWVNGYWHPVTTLYPRLAFQALGGFDESLPGVEDLDFYARSNAAGLCGIRNPRPLLEYGPGGQRSANFKNNPQRQAILDSIKRRYNPMCCGKPNPTEPTINNEPQTGDVLAVALYTPSTQNGRATGRHYARTRYQNQEMYVASADIAAAPELWQISPKEALKAVAPDVDLVSRLATEALHNG